jgi:hypothetical protein
MRERIQLDEFAFYGRTLAEYTRFFDLDLAALKGHSLLDCPAGAASFVAEARAIGIQAVAIDPLFSESVEKLRANSEADIESVVRKAQAVSHLFVWDYYKDPEDLRAARRMAAERFLADFPAGRSKGHYCAAKLPYLPYPEKTFDLVLSGHFLFTYSDILSYDFHLSALKELVRVSRHEVRVYPVAGTDSKPYPRLVGLRRELGASGVNSELRRVPFEFQRGSNEMLALWS